MVLQIIKSLIKLMGLIPVVYILLFIIVNEKNVAPLLGAPGAPGPRFIEPPEPPVSTPLDFSLLKK